MQCPVPLAIATALGPSLRTSPLPHQSVVRGTNNHRGIRVARLASEESGETCSAPVESRPLMPGTLWMQIVAQSKQALDQGALQPFATTDARIEQGKIRFIVRVAANLLLKDKSNPKGASSSAAPDQDFNPFLPYEPDLFVADLSKTHLVILNKFPVVNHHILIITRQFEAQQSWLTLADFTAMVVCLEEFEGLGFYNSCRLADASQRHKHLQIIPLPLVAGAVGAPIETVVGELTGEEDGGTLPHFPFVHGMARLNWDQSQSAADTAQTLLACYHALLGVVGINLDGQPPAPYNLLITRRWMLIVPRSQESCAGISINSLGFAGSLFVRNQAQLRQLKQIGPLAILQGVAVAKSEKLP